MECISCPLISECTHSCLLFMDLDESIWEGKRQLLHEFAISKIYQQTTKRVSYVPSIKTMPENTYKNTIYFKNNLHIKK